MLHQLPKITERRKKRLGRGTGSGAGAKSGRGTTRHQTAREKIPLHFEGGQGRMVKRYPLLRGKGKNKPVTKIVAIPLQKLNMFNDGDTVSKETLFEKKLLNTKNFKKQVKIILTGEITKKLTVQLPVSAGARDAIEKAGGTINAV